MAPPSAGDSPSRSRALEALGDAGSVLDVGCGGGAAGLALVPPAHELAGIDCSAPMLAELEKTAMGRGVNIRTVLGAWPDCQDSAPTSDVVVCHHVVYNVAAVTPFLRALAAHARRRVVIELSARHPLSGLTPAWRHFWGLERPNSPTADDLLAVLAEDGVNVGVERWTRPPREASLDERAALARVRLCLPESRFVEVRDFLAANPPDPSDTVTVWWDPGSPG
ncbi:MAG TPA: class I SAM-dependent methyltransferase [Acidimicrobiales bacterium]|nr:class I SAM-dependent methyltransferase [Acidimicrobiales bacterium]